MGSKTSTGDFDLNTYTTEFFAICPENNIRVHYKWRVETDTVLKVEDLIDEVNLHSRGYHEEIADQLQRSFGGKQNLTAFHHGVLIETTRS